MQAFSRKQNLKYFLMISLTTVFVLVLSFVYSGHELKKERKHFVKSELSVQEAADFLKSDKENKDVILIDLRTPGEYTEGHIHGSVFLDYYNGKTKQKLSELDKSKDYLLVDKAGRTIKKVMKKMKKLGFSEAHSVKGGMNEWYQSQMPVEKAN